MARLLRQAGCVYADDEARLLVEAAQGDQPRLAQLTRRRCAGEPLELVVGFAEFAGRRVRTEPGVFVPRQRTAGLVGLALDTLRSTDDPGVVVDLGCGTGALLMALLRRRSAEAYALDASDAAVTCARRNLAGTGAVVLRSDYFSALPAAVRGRVRVVLANLPYVPTASVELMPREARLYEPRATLDGGADGLVPLAAALALARDWLRPGAVYLCELYVGQLPAAARLAESLGYAVEAETDPDETGALVRLTAGW